MSKTLSQKIVISAPPKQVYRYYMDEKLHTQLTGAKAKVSSAVGDAFSAFQGDIKGKNLYLKTNEVIFQSWRYKSWPKSDPDSYLLLIFNKSEEGTELEVAHTNIPDEQFAQVRKGWNQFYWKRWRAFSASGGKETKGTRGRPAGSASNAKTAGRPRKASKPGPRKPNERGGTVQ